MRGVPIPPSAIAAASELQLDPGPIVMLHRHGCGHYQVEIGSSKLPAGYHGSVGVRITTTDALCLACDFLPYAGSALAISRDPKAAEIARSWAGRANLLAEHRP